MIRSTTNGVLKGYRYNLQRSTYTLNKSRDTVITQRNFNSFAEDPAAAAQSFQLRRSYLRTESQLNVGESVVRKYDVAWDTLQSVVDDVSNQASDSAYDAVIRAQSDTSGGGRNALGQSLCATAKSIIQTMNARYGDNFVFSGADGLTIPFTWETDANGNEALVYRGVAVDAAANQDGTDTEDLAALKYMVNKEVKYVDVGLGLEEDENGEVLSSSAANVALQGINFLGYGVDEDGDPKNLASILNRMGTILLNCDSESGAFKDGVEKDEFYRLAGKFDKASALLTDKHVELDGQAEFLQSNQKQLESTAYTLQEQFLGIEDADLADAITAYSWAQYCYNAALKVGNSILSESLMDYLQM